MSDIERSPTATTAQSNSAAAGNSRQRKLGVGALVFLGSLMLYVGVDRSSPGT
jgi:hypothetical protein